MKETTSNQISDALDGSKTSQIKLEDMPKPISDSISITITKVEWLKNVKFYIVIIQFATS